ncbi:MAG: septum formation inhibitor Maf [Clostridiales bacterium]|nr:septum formation inhibitor Maf [Clostridiales bacterium]
MSVVLASASPRRRELLLMLRVENLKIIPALGEEVIDEGMTPEEAVCALSFAKAKEVSKLCSTDDIIIAADTVVAVDGMIIGKPDGEEDAFRMLSLLSGRTHNVFTGVTVMRKDEIYTEYERTAVRFRELSESEIRAYIKTGEPMDKAGAYGAQGIGSLFVEGIEGDFFNVMGLPLCRLSKMLNKMGVRLI